MSNDIKIQASSGKIFQDVDCFYYLKLDYLDYAKKNQN